MNDWSARDIQTWEMVPLGQLSSQHRVDRFDTEMFAPHGASVLILLRPPCPPCRVNSGFRVRGLRGTPRPGKWFLSVSAPPPTPHPEPFTLNLNPKPQPHTIIPHPQPRILDPPRPSRSSRDPTCRRWGHGNPLGGLPRDQTMLRGHLPRVTYHQLYYYTKNTWNCRFSSGRDLNRSVCVCVCVWGGRPVWLEELRHVHLAVGVPRPSDPSERSSLEGGACMAGTS